MTAVAPYFDPTSAAAAPVPESVAVADKQKAIQFAKELQTTRASNGITADYLKTKDDDLQNLYAYLYGREVTPELEAVRHDLAEWKVAQNDAEKNTALESLAVTLKSVDTDSKANTLAALNHDLGIAPPNDPAAGTAVDRVDSRQEPGAAEAGRLQTVQSGGGQVQAPRVSPAVDVAIQGVKDQSLQAVEEQKKIALAQREAYKTKYPPPTNEEAQAVQSLFATLKSPDVDAAYIQAHAEDLDPAKLKTVTDFEAHKQVLVEAAPNLQTKAALDSYINHYQTNKAQIDAYLEKAAHYEPNQVAMGQVAQGVQQKVDALPKQFVQDNFSALDPIRIIDGGDFDAKKAALLANAPDDTTRANVEDYLNFCRENQSTLEQMAFFQNETEITKLDDRTRRLDAFQVGLKEIKDGKGGTAARKAFNAMPYPDAQGANPTMAADKSDQSEAMRELLGSLAEPGAEIDAGTVRQALSLDPSNASHEALVQNIMTTNKSAVTASGPVTQVVGSTNASGAAANGKGPVQPSAAADIMAPNNGSNLQFGEQYQGSWQTVLNQYPIAGNGGSLVVYSDNQDLVIKNSGGDKAIVFGADGLRAIGTNPADNHNFHYIQNQHQQLKPGESRIIDLEANGDGPTKRLFLKNDAGNLSASLYHYDPDKAQWQKTDYVLNDGQWTLGSSAQVMSDQVKNDFQAMGSAPINLFGSDGNLYTPDGVRVLGASASMFGHRGGPGADGSGLSDTTGFNPYLAAADGMRLEAFRKGLKTEKERLLEMLCAAAAGGGLGGGIGGGLGGGYFGGGPGFGGQGLGVGVNFGNENFGANVGFGTDFNGNFGVNLGFQNQNFGFNLGFNKGLNSAPCHPGFCVGGGVLDFEFILLLIVTILEQMEREKIAGIVKRMGQKSTQMKEFTGEQAKANPYFGNALQQESAIEQAELQMAVQSRQRLLDTLNNIIRVGHEAKQNAIRRMV